MKCTPWTRFVVVHQDPTHIQLGSKIDNGLILHEVQWYLCYDPAIILIPEWMCPKMPKCLGEQISRSGAAWHITIIDILMKSLTERHFRRLSQVEQRNTLVTSQNIKIPTLEQCYSSGIMWRSYQNNITYRVTLFKFLELCNWIHVTQIIRESWGGFFSEGRGI